MIQPFNNRQTGTGTLPGIFRLFLNRISRFQPPPVSSSPVERERERESLTAVWCDLSFVFLQHHYEKQAVRKSFIEITIHLLGKSNLGLYGSCLSLQGTRAMQTKQQLMALILCDITEGCYVSCIITVKTTG